MTNIAQIPNTINDKSVDGVLGTRTQGVRMVSGDESTELWRHPKFLHDFGAVNYNCKMFNRLAAQSLFYNFDIFAKL